MMNSDNYKILRDAKRIDISVISMPLGRAVDEAQRYYNQHNPHKPPAETEMDHRFLERITVDYLQYTCFRRKTISDFLLNIDDNNIRRQAQAIIKGRQLADIARKYPPLASEAQRQAIQEDKKKS